MQTGMAGIFSRLIGCTWKLVPMTLRDVPAETSLLIKQTFQCTRAKIKFNPLLYRFWGWQKTSSFGKSIIYMTSEISLGKTEITILGKNPTAPQTQTPTQNQKKKKNQKSLQTKKASFKMGIHHVLRSSISRSGVCTHYFLLIV